MMKTINQRVNGLFLLIRSSCSSRRAERFTVSRQPGWWLEQGTSSRNTLPTRLARWDTINPPSLILEPLLTAKKHPGLIWHATFLCVFQVVSSHETQAQEDDPHTVRLEFEPSLYQCFENYCLCHYAHDDSPWQYAVLYCCFCKLNKTENRLFVN